MIVFQELMTEYGTLKDRAEQVDSFKVQLLNDVGQTDFESVKKLANEYLSMFEDIDERLQTLKELFQEPTQSKRMVRKVSHQFFTT